MLLSSRILSHILFGAETLSKLSQEAAASSFARSIAAFIRTAARFTLQRRNSRDGQLVSAPFARRRAPLILHWLASRHHRRLVRKRRGGDPIEHWKLERRRRQGWMRIMERPTGHDKDRCIVRFVGLSGWTYKVVYIHIYRQWSQSIDNWTIPYSYFVEHRVTMTSACLSSMSFVALI